MDETSPTGPHVDALIAQVRSHFESLPGDMSKEIFTGRILEALGWLQLAMPKLDKNLQPTEEILEYAVMRQLGEGDHVAAQMMRWQELGEKSGYEAGYRAAKQEGGRPGKPDIDEAIVRLRDVEMPDASLEEIRAALKKIDETWTFECPDDARFEKQFGSENLILKKNRRAKSRYDRAKAKLIVEPQTPQQMIEELIAKTIAKAKP
ncbi:MAG: hypothetical protein K2X38_21885 [Gemmataceae bacterium]|nr:hypothetical protein [Gemmataceae bacterium]